MTTYLPSDRAQKYARSLHYKGIDDALDAIVRPMCTLCDGITDAALLYCKTWTLDGRVCRIGQDIHDGLRCETCKAPMPCSAHAR